MIHHALTCAEAHERLSARLDGLAADESALAAHLLHCPECREHERSLARLRSAFEELREAPLSSANLWSRIERRAHGRPSAPLLARLAAAVVGFLGVAAAARSLNALRPLDSGDAPADPRLHLVERLLPAARGGDPFEALPEYRLLRALPTRTEDDSR